MRDRVVLPVVLEQVPRGIQHGFSSLNLVAVNVAVDVHRGLVEFGTSGALFENADDDRKTERRATNLNDREERWKRLLEFIHLREHRRPIAEVVEAQRGLCFGALLRNSVCRLCSKQRGE